MTHQPLPVNQSARTQAAAQALAAEYIARFPTEITLPRIVGREAEYPIVDATGRAADVRRLWDSLLRSGDFQPKYDTGNPNLTVTLEGEAYSYALEVGLGTVEINTRPCQDLHEIAQIMTDAVENLVGAALRLGWRVLGYGIQPVTPPRVRLMTPKQRYQSLYRAMGEEWLWYAVTASDQVQIDISRAEMVGMLNYGNLMAPVLIALCGNSPVYDARLSRFCSAREGRMAGIHANEHRHGMPACPYTSIADYVETVSQSTHLILQTDGEVIPSSRSFSAYLAEAGPDFEAFLFHEHYIWNSARLRPAYGTIELRPACQQPWHEQMAAAALGVGLIEAAGPIDGYIQETLGPAYWNEMRRYHLLVIARGLSAPQPAPDFLHTILTWATEGLAARGFGEERWLEPVWTRLRRRVNPAQHIRRVFQLDGLAGLLRQSAIHPSAVRYRATRDGVP